MEAVSSQSNQVDSAQPEALDNSESERLQLPKLGYLSRPVEIDKYYFDRWIRIGKDVILFCDSKSGINKEKAYKDLTPELLNKLDSLKETSRGRIFRNIKEFFKPSSVVNYFDLNRETQ